VASESRGPAEFTARVQLAVDDPRVTQLSNGLQLKISRAASARPFTSDGAPAISESGEIRVGVVHWCSYDDAVIGLISGIIKGMGYSVVDFLVDEPLPRNLDLAVIFGPGGPLAPLILQLLEIPLDRRPRVAFLHAEQLPNPRLPEWVQFSLGTVRSWFERTSYRKGSNGGWRISPMLRWPSTWALRFRYWGDIHWLRKNQMLATLAMASVWRAKLLSRQGFEVLGTPAFGYPMTPEWGATLGLERDIPVLWLGKPGSRRRRKLLRRVFTALRSRGVKIMIIDGEENPYVFGYDRTVLLNRTKIVLNLLRQPFDENGGRFYLASANGAMVVTEPLLPHHPAFVPGVHFVQCPVDRMAETIEYYLHHETERCQIAQRAHELVTTDMAIEQTVKAIMAASLAGDPCRKT
jgi:hypothetical protein